MKTFIKLSSVLLLFLVLGFLIFLTACGRANPNPAPVPPPEPQPPLNESDILTEYFPLAEGSSWVYEGIGNEFASYTQKVTHTQGDKAQVLVSSGTSTANRYEITPDSILHTYRQHEFYEGTSILDKPANIQAIVLKLPLTTGNSWQSESNTCEIIDTGATVETPAGTFKECLSVKTTYPDSTNYSIHYYAKGLGMVKSEYFMPEGKIISQLSSYKVNPS